MTEYVQRIIERVIQFQREYNEQSLADIIQKYDFIVGSVECKSKLMEVLPEDTNVICSRYVTSPEIIYAIKKFDIVELLKEEQQGGETE